MKTRMLWLFCAIFALFGSSTAAAQACSGCELEGFTWEGPFFVGKGEPDGVDVTWIPDAGSTDGVCNGNVPNCIEAGCKYLSGQVKIVVHGANVTVDVFNGGGAGLADEHLATIESPSTITFSVNNGQQAPTNMECSTFQFLDLLDLVVDEDVFHVSLRCLSCG